MALLPILEQPVHRALTLLIGQCTLLAQFVQASDLSGTGGVREVPIAPVRAQA